MRHIETDIKNTQVQPKAAEEPLVIAAQEFPAADSENTPPAENTSSTESPVADHSLSDEWDASKVPPSQFQKVKGSILATPATRDGHVDANKDRDAAYHDHILIKGKEKWVLIDELVGKVRLGNWVWRDGKALRYSWIMIFATDRIGFVVMNASMDFQNPRSEN